MQVAVDAHDGTTVYADLREEELLTDELRARAIRKAQRLGAQHVEFWRPPYGSGADRMEGFVVLARVPAASERDGATGELMCEPVEAAASMQYQGETVDSTR